MRDATSAGSPNASGGRCSTTRFRVAVSLSSAPWPTTTAGSSVISRANLALCLAEVGEFAEAVVRGEEARRIAEEIDHSYSRIAACLGLGGVWVRQGEFEKAVTVLERGFRLCEEARSPFCFPGSLPSGPMPPASRDVSPRPCRCSSRRSNGPRGCDSSSTSRSGSPG